MSITCGSCGYIKSNGEAIFEGIFYWIKKIFPSQQTKTASFKGDEITAFISNNSEVKCPKCGEKGRWI